MPSAGSAQVRRVLHVCRRLRRHALQDHPDPGEPEHASQREDPGHADRMVERRRGDEGHREHEADGGADDRHDLRTVLLAREIGGERHHRRGDRAGALDAPPEDREPDVLRGGGEKAAGGEHQQPEHDHALAAETVRGHAVRNLQARLGEAIRAERDPDEHEVVAAPQARRVHREDREDQEQPQHAQREERAERDAGAELLGRHRAGGQRGLHREKAGRRHVSRRPRTHPPEAVSGIPPRPGVERVAPRPGNFV